MGFRGFSADKISERDDFGDGDIQLLGDLIAQRHLRQNAGQLRFGLQRDAVFFGDGQYLLSGKTFAFGRDFRGILAVVLQGDGNIAGIEGSTAHII